MKSISLLVCFLWASAILGAIATPMFGQKKGKGKKDPKIIGSTSSSDKQGENREIVWRDGQWWNKDGKLLTSMDGNTMKNTNFENEAKAIEARRIEQGEGQPWWSELTQDVPWKEAKLIRAKALSKSGHNSKKHDGNSP